jgi:uncharacterized protein YdhG (YjbR/CyaY superfamily)
LKVIPVKGGFANPSLVSRPFSGSTLKTLRRDVSRYDQTKSSLHFSPDDLLPVTLVRKLIRTRIAETKK